GPGRPRSGTDRLRSRCPSDLVPDFRNCLGWTPGSRRSGSGKPAPDRGDLPVRRSWFRNPELDRVDPPVGRSWFRNPDRVRLRLGEGRPGVCTGGPGGPAAGRLATVWACPVGRREEGQRDEPATSAGGPLI